MSLGSILFMIFAGIILFGGLGISLNIAYKNIKKEKKQ
ncbi:MULTISPECIES: MetS family NSS transporter small subunit [Oceanotoga]|jgi:hypothetical protein|nr:MULTISPECIES: MetS family NSS transporter small subunit [Oceanotoga]MDN5342369.1 hypothetical protein [Oceanotoga sp.]MDO7976092.1 MetS family NSS transporter small subunit [Oceanotoga teriensis]